MKQYGIYDKSEQQFCWDHWGSVFVFSNRAIAEAQLIAYWRTMPALPSELTPGEFATASEILEIREFLEGEEQEVMYALYDKVTGIPCADPWGEVYTYNTMAVAHERLSALDLAINELEVREVLKGVDENETVRYL